MNRIWPRIFQLPRIWKYNILSSIAIVEGEAVCNQPLLMEGNGQIIFGKDVQIGVRKSPSFYNSYAYISARCKGSFIKIGQGSRIGNNFAISSEEEGVEIGERCLIGSNVQIFDSDFHSLKPSDRFGGEAQGGKVVIGQNVFIGSNVVILKGVSIGDNSVIGSGSVVTRSVPENVVAAGIPAVTIKQL